MNQNYEVIYNDDDKGEAADVIAIKTETTGNDIKLIIELYHCKFSSSSSPGNRLDDLYVVCGQAQRSAHFREDPIRLLRHLLRRNPIRRNGQEFSRYEVGDKNTLLAITQKAYQAEVIMKVFIVQPGVSISGLTEEQNKLLAVTDNYLMETYQLPFYAILSA